MNRDERYIAHHKALYLHRLVTHRRFPAEFMFDGNFTAAVAELIGDAAFDALAEAGNIQYGNTRLRRYKARRPVAEDGDGPLIGELLGRVADDLARTARKTGRGLASAPLHRKFERLGQILELDRCEAEIFRFYGLCGLDTALNDLLDDSDLDPLRSSYARFVAHLLQIPAGQVVKRIAHGSRLRRMGVLEGRDVPLDRNHKPEIAEAMLKTLADTGITPERVIDSFYSPEPAAHLGSDDFAHLGPAFRICCRVLEETWKRRRRGINLLLYGAPGLGKTQFARLLADAARGNAFAMPRRDDDGDTSSAIERRIAYEVFQRMCRGEKRPLLIIDEAEALLVEERSFFGGRTGNSDDLKAWLTQALVENPLPVIWIVNHHNGIHDAVKRRFAYSVAFPELDRDVVRRIWGNVLDEAGPRFALPPAALERLAERYDLSPGHIAQGVATWKQVTGRSKPRPELLEHILEQAQRLCLGARPGPAKLRELDARYDPALLAIEGDFDPARLKRAIARFYDLRKPGRKGPKPHQLTLLFHGPSGAGKTELAKHLAKKAGHNVQVERMSDLLSPWVGMSEKQIAGAFRRAEQGGSILLLDEFDSLAFDRKKSTKSWETSQVNELLQQIENFSGVLIGSTNLLERLDPAISRRFSHKIGFRGIPPQARAHAVATYFADQLEGKPFPRELRARLVALPALYPGDLRAVRQRYETNLLCGEKLSTENLVAALEREASYHKGEKRRIGFARGGDP